MQRFVHSILLNRSRFHRVFSHVSVMQASTQVAVRPAFYPSMRCFSTQDDDKKVSYTFDEN